MLAGVAAGVAETLDADPSLVRILWALLAILTGGIAFVVYIVMAIVVPEAPDETEPVAPPVAGAVAPNIGGAPAQSAAAPLAAEQPAGPTTAPMPSRAEWRAARRAARRERRREAFGSGEAGLIFGVILIVIGALFLLRQAIPWFGFHIWLPIGIVALGVLLIVVAMRPGRPTE
jgi:phage shock protein C